MRFGELGDSTDSIFLFFLSFFFFFFHFFHSFSNVFRTSPNANSKQFNSLWFLSEERFLRSSGTFFFLFTLPFELQNWRGARLWTLNRVQWHDGRPRGSFQFLVIRRSRAAWESFSAEMAGRKHFCEYPATSPFPNWSRTRSNPKRREQRTWNKQRSERGIYFASVLLAAPLCRVKSGNATNFEKFSRIHSSIDSGTCIFF